MKPKKIWANLAVADLARTTKFYMDLGFKSNGANTSSQLRSFLIGLDDFVVHFFLKNVLKDSMKTDLVDTLAMNEVLFTLSADSKEQVDSWAVEVQAAGGTLVSKPETFGEGYYGFDFSDPDGHRFNVFFMEGF